jgi:hypothetical protein
MRTERSKYTRSGRPKSRPLRHKASKLRQAGRAPLSHGPQPAPSLCHDRTGETPGFCRRRLAAMPRLKSPGRGGLLRRDQRVGPVAAKQPDRRRSGLTPSCAGSFHSAHERASGSVSSCRRPAPPCCHPILIAKHPGWMWERIGNNSRGCDIRDTDRSERQLQVGVMSGDGDDRTNDRGDDAPKIAIPAPPRQTINHPERRLARTLASISPLFRPHAVSFSKY